MSDLIERLRTADNEDLWACANEAADALEAKDKEIAQLRATLHEIAHPIFLRRTDMIEIARKALEGKL
jgi:hypothetical protein